MADRQQMLGEKNVPRRQVEAELLVPSHPSTHTRAHPRSHSPLLRYARSGLWVEGLGMSGVCQSHVDQVLAITAIKPRTSPPSKKISKLRGVFLPLTSRR